MEYFHSINVLDKNASVPSEVLFLPGISFVLNEGLGYRVEYNCELIKVDWLAACTAIRVVGAVLFVLFAQSSSQWEARADTGRNVPNPADQ
jgi:hypothetical protein